MLTKDLLQAQLGIPNATLSSGCSALLPRVLELLGIKNKTPPLPPKSGKKAWYTAQVSMHWGSRSVLVHRIHGNMPRRRVG